MQSWQLRISNTIELAMRISVILSITLLTFPNFEKSKMYNVMVSKRSKGILYIYQSQIRRNKQRFRKYGDSENVIVVIVLSL